MPRHPTQGVPGSKPRLPKFRGNGQPSNKAEMQRLSRESLASRNRQMEAKAYLAEMEAQRRRGELLDKRRIAVEIGDVFVAFRTEVLSFPARYAAQMVGLRDEHEAKQTLTKAAHEFLIRLSELRPAKIFQHEGTRAKSLSGRPPPSNSRLRKRRRRFVVRRKLRPCAACGEKVPKSAKPASTSLRMGARGSAV